MKLIKLRGNGILTAEHEQDRRCLWLEPYDPDRLMISEFREPRLTRDQVQDVIRHLQAWVETGSLEFKESEAPMSAIDVAAMMVRQHCHVGGGIYDSMAISVNAEAMDMLANRGRFVIDKECGRRIIGRFVETKESEVTNETK